MKGLVLDSNARFPISRSGGIDARECPASLYTEEEDVSNGISRLNCLYKRKSASLAFKLGSERNWLHSSQQPSLDIHVHSIPIRRIIVNAKNPLS